MNQKPKYNFFHRLQLAITGILVALKRERHMKFHVLFSFTILTPLIWIPQPILYKWILVILVALLIITELINTAIELTIDLITKQFKHRAKLAKDTASGAVLIMALLVLGFSMFIYYPSMYNLSIGVFIGN